MQGLARIQQSGQLDFLNKMDSAYNISGHPGAPQGMQGVLSHGQIPLNTNMSGSSIFN